MDRTGAGRTRPPRRPWTSTSIIFRHRAPPPRSNSRLLAPPERFPPHADSRGARDAATFSPIEDEEGWTMRKLAVAMALLCAGVGVAAAQEVKLSAVNFLRNDESFG